MGDNDAFETAFTTPYPAGFVPRERNRALKQTKTCRAFEDFPPTLPPLYVLFFRFVSGLCAEKWVKPSNAHLLPARSPACIPSTPYSVHTRARGGLEEIAEEERENRRRIRLLAVYI